MANNGVGSAHLFAAWQFERRSKQIVVAECKIDHDNQNPNDSIMIRFARYFWVTYMHYAKYSRYIVMHEQIEFGSND